MLYLLAEEVATFEHVRLRRDVGRNGLSHTSRYCPLRHTSICDCYFKAISCNQEAIP